MLSTQFRGSFVPQLLPRARAGAANRLSLRCTSSSSGQAAVQQQELNPRASVAPVYDRREVQQLASCQPGLAIIRCLQVLVAFLKLAALQVQHSTQQQHKRPASADSAYVYNKTAQVAGASGAASAGQAPQPGSQHTTAYAAAVRQVLSDLGPLWVKLGQTVSVRPDLVGKRLAGALAGLQEGAPPFADAAAAAIIEQDLGAPVSELFSWLSAKPVASASLGQVYQAALADGTLVAVKVQRPGVWHQLQLDLAILLSLLAALRSVARVKQDITRWADTLGTGLAQELDYLQEARNLELFAAAHSHLGFVKTPAVVWELTSHRVLTTTWMEGSTPGQILKQAEATSSSSNSSSSTVAGAFHRPTSQQQLLQLVSMGVEATLSQLVVTGVLHADPHPGNLLLIETPEGDCLAYLDFGLLVQVPPQASLAMMSALMHWALADWSRLAHDLGDMGLLKDSTDRREVADELQKQFEKLYSTSSTSTSSRSIPNIVSGEQGTAGAATLLQSSSLVSSGQAGSLNKPSASILLARAGSISFGDFAGVIATLAVRFRFELPPYYTLVIRSLTTLEGFALVVDPNARQDIARTAVKVVARQLLCDSRPAAQQLVLQMLKDPQQPDLLNLPLLEELLLMQQQQQQHLQQQATSSHNKSSSRIRDSAIKLQQQQQQTSKAAISKAPSGHLIGPWLALALQELDPSQLAQQFTSKDAAQVRAVAAQWIADWLTQQKRHRVCRPASADASNPSPQWHVKTAHYSDGASHVVKGAGQQRAREVNDNRPEVGVNNIIKWLWLARWHAVLLLWQVLSLAAALVVRWLLAVFFVALSNLRP